MWERRAARSLAILAAGAVLTALAGAVAATLRFDSSYEALLPPGSAELAETRRVRDRAGGVRHLVVAISGEDAASRRVFARRLAERLRRIPGVRFVDEGFPVGFLEERGLWLLDADDLEELTAAAERAIPDVEGAPADGAALALVGQRIASSLASLRARLPFDETLTSRDGRTTFLLVVPSVNVNDLAAGRRLLDELDESVVASEPSAGGLEVRCSGTMVLYHEQHRRIGRDLALASIVALALCSLLVAVATRWLPGPLLVALALLPGVVWTFAATRLWCDHVNVVTGFLVAVLVGLGVDHGVHLLVRYRQEARRPGVGSEEALARSVRETLRPAVTSAATTAGTFLAFAASDFPGFREVGLVAATGVPLTLASTYLLLPPLLVISERWQRPSAARRGARPPRPVSPRWLRRAGAALSVVLVALAAHGALAFDEIPYRNDFRRLGGDSPAADLADRIGDELGLGINPAVLLVETEADAARAAALARRIRDAEAEDGGGGPAIAEVLSVTDLLPTEVDRHRELMARLRAASRHPAVAEAAPPGGELAARRERLAALLDAEPWGRSELPEELRRRFVTLDGAGLLVYLWPSERIESDFQARAWERQLSRLAGALQREGVDASIADEVLIHGWISRLVARDAPRVLPLAVAAVLLVLFADLRRLGHTALVALPLAVSVLAFLGAAQLLGLELNMYNLLAVPTVIGIGIDGAVHLFHRHRRLGPGSLGEVLRTTGPSVVVASATTAVGFGSSLVCHHRGLQSLGEMTILGIACTLAAALALLPMALDALDRRGGRTPSPGQVARTPPRLCRIAAKRQTTGRSRRVG